jgi:hypothetical protein
MTATLFLTRLQAAPLRDSPEMPLLGGSSCSVASRNGVPWLAGLTSSEERCGGDAGCFGTGPARLAAWRPATTLGAVAAGAAGGGRVGVATLPSFRPLDIGFVLGAICPLAVLSYGPLATAALGAASISLLIAPRLQLDRPGSTDVLNLVPVSTERRSAASWWEVTLSTGAPGIQGGAGRCAGSRPVGHRDGRLHAGCLL